MRIIFHYRWNNPKEMIAAALLHRALGSGPRVKYGNSKGALNAATKTPIESVASGFSASYTDSGLVGAFLTASHCCIEKVFPIGGNCRDFDFE